MGFCKVCLKFPDHVIVTHAFLRSLANLELEPSRVGALRAAAEAAISPVVRR